MTRFRSAAAVGVAAGMIMAIAGLAGVAHAAPSRSRLTGSAPPWAKTSARHGASATSAAVGFRVYLGWHDQGGAEALAGSVSDPRSASYGKYLTPAQFRQRFAPSKSDVDAVTSWLSQSGIKAEYVPGNNHYVSAEGTVAQVQSAFGVQLADYSVAGQVLRAPSSDLTVPASLAPIVSGVLGVDESAALVHTDRVGTDAPPSAGFRNAPPCSAYWGQHHASDAGLPAFNGKDEPFAPCGATPAQLRTAYDVAGTGTTGGAGQTVAVIDAYASPTIRSDVDTYSARHGLPTFEQGQFSEVVPPGVYHHKDSRSQDPSGWYGEETLDVEAVHTMAPGAAIVYVGAPNNYQDLDAALNHVVDNGLAQIVTNSYGSSTEFLPTGYIKPYNDTLIEAAAVGIGVYFSSGDGGDELVNNGYATADWPASSPWVTAVGGTSLGVRQDNGYLFETGWGTYRSRLASGAWGTPTFLYGGGGGTSRLFAEPAYQQGVVPASLAGRWDAQHPGRVVPDVAMDGDPNTGMLVGQTQTFSDGVYYDEYRIGGTSLSSPLFAGMMALADQAANRHHGFANPALYAASGNAFHDISGPGPDNAVARADYVNGENATDGISYTMRTLNDTGTIAVRSGYDDVTGRGTPRGTAFIAALKH